MSKPPWSDGQSILKQVTEVVREADRIFQDSGGTSRHWARECFLPLLRDRGLSVVKASRLRSAERLLQAGRQFDRGAKSYSSNFAIDLYAWMAEVGEHLAAAKQEDGDE